MTIIAPPLPFRTRMVMIVRLLTIQGSYNYETMVGNGIAFALEPALRLLPGGPRGDAYRDAVARESRYFNAHPYLAAVAVGALAKAELSLEDPDRIERFRTAACGPLGSVGDRLVWAAWLPFCSLLALLAVGLGFEWLSVATLFLLLYNAGHLALRIWGLNTGWARGLAVAPALGNRLFREGPALITRGAAFLAGVGMPVLVANIASARAPGAFLILAIAGAGALLLVLTEGRVAGWRAATWLLVAFTAWAVIAR